MFDRLRAFAVVGCWAAGLAILGPVCILMTMITGWEGFVSVPSTAIIRVGWWISRVRITIEGLDRIDPRGTYVFAPNHQSILDPAILWSRIGSARHRAGFLIKRELQRVPILGIGLLQIGMLTVDRSNSERARESARRATERIKAGRSFIVYPEGTRTRDGRVLPFKRGAFFMAIEAGVPVVPISLSGFFNAMPPGGLRLRNVPMRVVFHEPIPTIGLSPDDVGTLADRVREIVASAVEENRTAVLPPPASRTGSTAPEIAEISESAD